MLMSDDMIALCHCWEDLGFTTALLSELLSISVYFLASMLTLILTVISCD